MADAEREWGTVEEAADRSPDIDYRHVFTEIAESDVQEFGRQLTKLLNDVARIGGRVVHLSTTAVSHADDIVHVAHVVFTLPVEERRPVSET